MTQAPVLIEFCRIESDGHYHVEFRPAFHVPKEAAAEGQGGPWVQRFIDALQEQIRTHPTNSNDYFFWHGAEIRVA
jgi:KDO2-lipid IV(A) lauroyltransferase